MTTNPQSRRPSPPIDLPPNPTLSPQIISFINQRIRQHEIHASIISASIVIPFFIYTLSQINHIKSLLPLS